MNKKQEHTPGPWIMVENGANDFITIEGRGSVVHQEDLGGIPDEMSSAGRERLIDELFANARLIAEAGTVAAETGKTPRQLADERAELLQLVELLLGDVDYMITCSEGLKQLAWMRHAKAIRRVLKKAEEK